MANMFDCWGFGKIIATGPDDGTDLLGKVQAAFCAGARDLGIAPDQPSDALDASRDSILADCFGNNWDIVDGTLYVAYGHARVEDLIANHASPFHTSK